MLLVLVLMRVFARNTNILANGPFSGAPYDSVPGHIRVVLNVFIVKLDTSDAQQADIFIESQLIILSHVLHYLINICVLLCRGEGVSDNRVTNGQAIWVT